MPGTVGLLAGIAVALFGFFWIIDLLLVDDQGRGHTVAWLIESVFDFDAETLQNTLGSLAQIIVAVLGIAITVVSIVVQLAATRYSSHIATMFFRDRTNLAIMSFFVVSCIDAVWVSLAVSGHHIPRVSVTASLMMVTGSLLLLIPYFAYVFDFLDPSRVVARIGHIITEAAFAQHRFRSDGVAVRQAVVASNIEHLADVAVNSVSQKDKVIASQAVSTLREVLVEYLARKPRLPDAWFTLSPRLRDDPDFASMAPGSLAEIEANRTWLEWKTLRQLRNVLNESLQSLPEVAHTVAIETRRTGDAAVAAADAPGIAVTLKFLNTYLRTTLNERNIRAAYNILNEYRQLAEDVLRAKHDALVLEIAGYFKYYGQTAHGMGLGFVTETAAYDLSVLCERAFEQKAACHDDLLKTFLEVDKEAETTAEEKSLRGVRKAQARLASYYLQAGATVHARAIFEDMLGESPERLASIRAELMRVTAKDFWEVTDRGINFDYLDSSRKEKLEQFFSWFLSRPTASA